MAMEKTFQADAAEDRLYKAWEEAGCFTAGKHVQNSETASYCIMIPPPNVTGSLHMGHAFNNTLQDILVRWHRMRGFDTLWQPGQDHAGIATQMVVERELAKDGIKRTDFSREEFVSKVWEQKEKSGGTIINQLRRLGATCDWSRNAFTMAGAPGDTRVGHENSPDFHDAVIKTFVDMYNDGVIYRGKRLVNWDPHFETAISDLEVENIEVPGHMWHFKYPLAGGATYEYVEKDEDGNVVLSETRDYISIATTRPETMLGDGAVAVHPSDERYAVIVGKLCEIPVGPKEHRRLIPIITDDYPDPDFGSGAVKITGAHDFNDYEVAKRGGIPMYNLMDTKGAMRADGAPYADVAAVAQRIAQGEEDFDEAKIAAMNLVPDQYRGLDRFDARKAVVADITAEGLAVMVANPSYDPDADEESRVGILPTIPYVENKPIMQPFGDRSKVVIEPMLTDQWFVETSKIVQPAIDAVRNGEVKILPEQHEKVYFHWLESIEPWCISRQLWWGHQIPVWYGQEVNSSGRHQIGKMNPFCAANEQEALKAAKLYYSNDYKIEIDNSELDTDPFSDEFSRGLLAFADSVDLPNLQEVNFHKLAQSEKVRKRITNGESKVIVLRRDPDVLDTWFSSGLWPIGTLGWPEQTEELKKYFPTNDLITGFDIIFFWVARMMMMQYATVQQKPFDTVYVHALVRDEKGKKMSKSLGNVMDPLDLIDEYGADAVRFTLTAMAAMGRDLKLSTQRIAGYRNFGTKLWNAMRFAEMNEVFDAPTNGIPTPDRTLNKWIIGETAKVRIEVDAALENYRFNDAASALYAFVWGKVCDWYVEFSKPMLQGDDADARAETQETMKWVLDQCLILLHPIMPFITEELWGTSAKRAQMLIHAEWPTYADDLVDAEADREMNWVIGLIDAIRSARQQMHVPAGLKIPMLVSEISDQARAAWDSNETLIKRLARIESLDATDSFPKGTITVAAAGASFGLPLAGIIDIAEEKARLEKTLGKLAKELGGLKGRLNNPKFAASAPPEVVEETRANLAARQEEEAKIKAALARLADMA
ncbi:MAG: valine--tRNA ligase [Rhodobacteraceae bacterium]|nr:valine--tRNA ligase [Paracoccaceae bacterium]